MKYDSYCFLGYDRTLRVWDTTRAEAPPTASGARKKAGKAAGGSASAVEYMLKNTHTTANSHDGAISVRTKYTCLSIYLSSHLFIFLSISLSIITYICLCIYI